MNEDRINNVTTPSKKFTPFELAWHYKYMVAPAILAPLKYYTSGPPHPTWTLAMTTYVDLVKTVMTRPPNLSPEERYEGTRRMRALIAIDDGRPITNGVVAPIKIPVRKIEMEGILGPLSNAEDGSRQIKAEWELHSEVKTPDSKVILNLHGGGYTFGSLRTGRKTSLPLSLALNCRVLSVDYRLSPETPFPGALFDVVHSYLYLTQTLGIPPADITVTGESAGGGLALALLLYLRDCSLPLPGASVLYSPYCDPTHSLSSWASNSTTDVLTLERPLGKSINAYLGADGAKYATHPYVTSVLASLTSLPPILIQVGGAETLLDESRLLASNAERDGVELECQIFEGGCHVFQVLNDEAISRVAVQALQEWSNKLDKGIGDQKVFEAIDEKLAEERTKNRNALERAAKARKELGKSDAYVWVPVRKDVAKQIECLEGGNERVIEEVTRANDRGRTGSLITYEARKK